MATASASWARISIWKVSDKEVPGDGAAPAICLPTAPCAPAQGEPGLGQAGASLPQTKCSWLFPGAPLHPSPMTAATIPRRPHTRPFLLSCCPHCYVLRVREMSIAIVWAWQPRLSLSRASLLSLSDLMDLGPQGGLPAWPVEGQR